jgi:hypothetical protein
MTFMRKIKFTFREHDLKVFENWVLRTVLYLEVISSIHNLRPCHVKRDPLNMEY